MRRVSVGLFVAALCAVSLQADPRRIDPKAYLEHVKFLASEDLEGRGNGSRGLESAADYIAAKFREAGLEPGGRWRHVLSAIRHDDRDVGRSGQLGDAAVGPNLGEVRRGTRLRDRVDVGQPVCRCGHLARGLCRLRHLRAGASLRRLRGNRRDRQSGADFHARAAGERPEKRVRRTNEHDALDDDAEGRGRATKRREGHPRRRRHQSSAGDRSVPPMAARAAGRRFRDSGVLSSPATWFSARSVRG